MPTYHCMYLLDVCVSTFALNLICMYLRDVHVLPFVFIYTVCIWASAQVPASASSVYKCKWKWMPACRAPVKSPPVRFLIKETEPCLTFEQDCQLFHHNEQYFRLDICWWRFTGKIPIFIIDSQESYFRLAICRYFFLKVHEQNAISTTNDCKLQGWVSK